MNQDSGHSAGGATAVPAVLDPANAQHVWAVCSAIQGSTQSTSNEERKAAEDSLKACQTSAGYTDVLIAIISSDASSAIRLVAVIILRSMIKSNWKATRGNTIRVVTTEEKQRIRDFLIGPTYRNEAEDSVAVQIAVTTAKVARSDWPDEWSSLFPTLMTAALIDTTVSNDTVVIRQQQHSRALSALHQTLKELSTKKFGFDKKAFAATVTNCFGPLKQLWTLLCTQMLTQQQTLSIDLIKRVTVCLKVLHRMMILGMPQLAHPEAPLWLQQILTHMQYCAGFANA
eukprot:5360-Heterococcus_DN1.PRE.3